MTHYVCPCCMGMRETPGVCMTEDCHCKGQELQECNCHDGKHEAIAGSKKETEESSS